MDTCGREATTPGDLRRSAPATVLAAEIPLATEILLGTRLAAARLAGVRANAAARIAADLTDVARIRAAGDAHGNLNAVGAPLLRAGSAWLRADAAARIAADFAHVAGVAT